MVEDPEDNEENKDSEYNRGKESSLAEWLQERMAELRQDLQAGKWPEGGDRLLRELGRLEASAEDMEMLSLVVNDALEGVDITRRYPTFYRRLLAEPQLRQIFLDAIDLLERSEAGDLEPLPQPADTDLSFLTSKEEEEDNPTFPVDRLRILLSRTREQLQELFAPPPAAVPLRSAFTGMEDDYITLLRSDVSTGEGEFEIILEGRRPAAGNALHLTVMLVPREESAARPNIDATLSWGTYEEKRALDARGRASFPPLPLNVILNERGDVLAGLELRLDAP